ncbi:hypothetical protein ICN10_00075 [Polynucleobacter sp. 86C-FISCH]|uniref:hypothetical protein n=1 Tax=Polynucleobacter sp. 86C-FISCH TaxID=2689101 RepID=UPI001C0CF4AC|nr:hypothetical protein [Polynucleobacter sp. 86C-FISCH]MBU3594795.1 hypothetical protein [Polynucleobacter sp. 86C-FISCH]
MKQYLLLADKINAINQHFLLNPNEIELLDTLAKRHIQKESMTVSDLINNRRLASPATLHTALKSLVNKNLIDAKIDKIDGRRKNLSLTTLALERYRKLNSLLRDI